MGSRLPPLRAVLVAALLAPPAALRAQETPPQTPPPDPCTPDEVDEEGWLDWVNTKVHRTVCASALWFDSFFGEAAVDEERDATFVRLGGGVTWDDLDGWGGDVRFRAKVSFPNLENRVHLVAGRGTLDAVVSGETDEIDVPDLPIESPGEEASDWLLGVGYVPLRGDTDRVGLSAGVRIDWPPDPYVRAYYRRNQRLARGLMLRFRQTVFWESIEGVGTTSRLDVDQVLGSRLLLRLRTSGTISENADGLRWQTGLQLYQSLGRPGVLRWEAVLYGESGRDVPLRDERLRLSYRTHVFREWLFVEARAGVHWPRDELTDERRATPEAGLGIEIASGDLGRAWFW